MPSNMKQSFAAKIKKIGLTYGEVYDTEVRESIGWYIQHVFIKQKEANPQEEFGMFTATADKRVRRVVQTFVKRLQKATVGYTDTERKAFVILNVPDEYVW